MTKLLVICGPTATGKTSIALSLAKKFNGELISSDSRQVYKGMDIGTGKDLPKNSKLIKFQTDKYGYYDVQGIKLWGYDLVNPKEEFSVSHYIEIANQVIDNIWERKKLPVLVGGTGLYIKGVVDGIETTTVPMNKNLRAELENKNREELLLILEKVSPNKAVLLNDSDKKNPRRLIRAIEIAEWSKKNPSLHSSILSNNLDKLFIGLTAPKEFIAKRIEKRVQERIDDGVENEIRTLLNSGINWNMQSMNTLGYKEWREYFEGKNNKESVIEKWINDEKKYAKRQMTWFKKDSRVNWFDITAKNWINKVEMLVKKWHNQ